MLDTYIVPFTCPSQSKQFVNTFCCKLFINQSFISFSLCRNSSNMLHNKSTPNKRWCKIKPKQKQNRKTKQSKNVKYVLLQALTAMCLLWECMASICFLLSNLGCKQTTSRIFVRIMNTIV